MEEKEHIKKFFGYTLRQLREEKNLSQEKLAELCDLDRTFIYRLERGLRQPTLATLFKIGKVFGIAPNKIVAAVEKRLEEYNARTLKKDH